MDILHQIMEFYQDTLGLEASPSNVPSNELRAQSVRLNTLRKRERLCPFIVDMTTANKTYQCNAPGRFKTYKREEQLERYRTKCHPNFRLNVLSFISIQSSLNYEFDLRSSLVPLVSVKSFLFVKFEKCGLTYSINAILLQVGNFE